MEKNISKEQKQYVNSSSTRRARKEQKVRNAISNFGEFKVNMDTKGLNSIINLVYQRILNLNTVSSLMNKNENEIFVANVKLLNSLYNYKNGKSNKKEGKSDINELLNELMCSKCE